MYLGVDGGGSKTAFALVDRDGRVLARHDEGGLYHPEIGLDGVREVLQRGVREILGAAGIAPQALTFAFIGVPCHGEDSRLQPQLDALPAAALPGVRLRCGNDVVCSWAGSLGGHDGISVVAGTGSIAYGEFAGRSARCGGWGEVLGDEGSAHWIARRGLALFTRMSDGRLPPGPLYRIVRQALALDSDLDLCGHVYGNGQGRCELASLAPLVTQAAREGDASAQRVLAEAADHLAALVVALRRQLHVPPGTRLPVSYSGGLFQGSDGFVESFGTALQASGTHAELQAPAFAPAIGAALMAARCAGTPLDGTALATLQLQPAAGLERSLPAHSGATAA